MSEQDNVIPFPGSLQERDFPVSRRKVLQRYEDGHCPHDRQTVDPEAHTLSCDACGQLLDPWEVLDRWAREVDHIQSRFDAAKVQAIAAEQRLRNLKSAEKNAKARIRKAERSTPTGDLILALCRTLHALRSDEAFEGRTKYEAIRDANNSLQRALERDAAELRRDPA